VLIFGHNGQIKRKLMTNEEIYEQYYAFVREQLDSEQYDTIPHCDGRILHDPSDCTYCDRPAWQQKRRELGIASTGCFPNPGEIICPADKDRPSWSESDHQRWYGNRPSKVDRDDPSLPEETFASKVMYFDYSKGE
jgi:hypothetical protein